MVLAMMLLEMMLLVMMVLLEMMLLVMMVLLGLEPWVSELVQLELQQVLLAMEPVR